MILWINLILLKQTKNPFVVMMNLFFLKIYVNFFLMLDDINDNVTCFDTQKLLTDFNNNFK
jgi:hypothetical protein